MISCVTNTTQRGDEQNKKTEKVQRFEKEEKEMKRIESGTFVFKLLLFKLLYIFYKRLLSDNFKVITYTSLSVFL